MLGAPSPHGQSSQAPAWRAEGLGDDGKSPSPANLVRGASDGSAVQSEGLEPLDLVIPLYMALVMIRMEFDLRPQMTALDFPLFFYALPLQRFSHFQFFPRAFPVLAQRGRSIGSLLPR